MIHFWHRHQIFLTALWSLLLAMLARVSATCARPLLDAVSTTLARLHKPKMVLLV
eukprot:COSAG02_NODE_36069_length_459_cov_1.277778_2_plen_54_part_01